MSKLIVFAALMSGCAGMQHRAAQASEVLAYGSLACDASSTNTAIQGGGYAETNPVMGVNPSPGAVSLYFMSASVGLFTANRKLPDWARIAVNTAVIGIEVDAEQGNHEVGVPRCGI